MYRRDRHVMYKSKQKHRTENKKPHKSVPCCPPHHTLSYWESFSSDATNEIIHTKSRASQLDARVAADLGPLVLVLHRTLLSRLSLGPAAGEGDARVADGQHDAGDNDHGALEDHEQHLVVSEVAIEALIQLRHAVDAADEDGNGRDGDGCCAQYEQR